MVPSSRDISAKVFPAGHPFPVSEHGDGVSPGSTRHGQTPWDIEAVESSYHVARYESVAGADGINGDNVASWLLMDSTVRDCESALWAALHNDGPLPVPGEAAGALEQVVRLDDGELVLSGEHEIGQCGHRAELLRCLRGRPEGGAVIEVERDGHRRRPGNLDGPVCGRGAVSLNPRVIPVTCNMRAARSRFRRGHRRKASNRRNHAGNKSPGPRWGHAAP